MAYKNTNPKLKGLGSTGLLAKLGNAFGLNAKTPESPVKSNTIPETDAKPNVGTVQGSAVPMDWQYNAEKDKWKQIPKTTQPQNAPSSNGLSSSQNAELNTIKTQQSAPLVDSATSTNNQRMSDDAYKAQQEREREAKYSAGRQRLNTGGNEPQDTSRSGLLQTATTMGTQSPEMITKINTQLSTKKEEIRKLEDEMARKISATQGGGGDLSFVTGKVARLQDYYNAKIQNRTNEMQSLATQLSSANQTFGTQSGLIQNALGEQGYQNISYDTRFGTGEDLASGTDTTGGGNAMNPMQAIPDLAQRINNGTLSPSQAESMLGGNPALSRLLDQEMTRLNPNYDKAVAEAQSGIRANTPQMRAIQEAALKTIPMVNQAYEAMPDMAKTDWALVNKITQGQLSKWFPDKFGRDKIVLYQKLVDNSRGEIATLIGSALGMTPTGAESLANGWIGDGATPQEIEQAYANAQKMVEDRITAQETSGQPSGNQSNTNTNTDNGGWSWNGIQ